MKVRRLLLWLIGIVAGLAFLGVVLVAVFVFQSVHPQRWTLKVSPADHGIAFEDVRFPSQEAGISLAGWWVPAKADRATVILCHGYPADRSDVEPLIPFLHRAGYNVLAFDFRRLGQSGGTMCTIGLFEPRDLHGAVDYAPTRSKKPIGTLGMSMGAAVCLMEAAEDKRVAAVVADSAYTSLDVQIRRRFAQFSTPFSGAAATFGLWLGNRVVGRPLASASPLAAVPNIAPSPILFIHGTGDRLIPDTDSEALFAAAHEPKELWLAPNSRHVQSYADHTEEYQRRVLAFFERGLR